MSETLESELRLTAMNALARREHSRAELSERLTARYPGSADQVGPVLDRLAEQGLQSDERFAEAYCRARVNRGYGPRHIESALRQKGVASLSIELALDGAGVDWCELAAAVLAKRFGYARPLDFRDKARRMRFLQYRGFGSVEIQHALDSVATEDDGG